MCIRDRYITLKRQCLQENQHFFRFFEEIRGKLDLPATSRTHSAGISRGKIGQPSVSDIFFVTSASLRPLRKVSCGKCLTKTLATICGSAAFHICTRQ